MNRLRQVVLIGSLLPLCWLGMMAVHESGHVVGAWLSGGTVAWVVLHPFTISRTDLFRNPQPLVVAWAGPVFGVLFPLAALGIAVATRIPWAFLLRFFAGFCLVANGAYIGIGSFERIGDAGDLLRHGSSISELWAFGALTVLLGFLCWHGLGPHFGLGASGGKVDRVAPFVCLAFLVLVVILELLFGGE